MVEGEPKFANMYARHFTQLAQVKPLLRKPRVRVGTMFMTGGFLCWTGAILARHFREAPAPFFVVYNVHRSGTQTGPQYILDTVERDVLPFADQAANFYDLVVTQEVSTRLRDSGPPETFLSRCGAGEMPVETALQFAWEWAINGAGLGILRPEKVVQYHEQMMQPLDPERWKRAYEAGLNTTPTQEFISFEQREREEVENFAAFVREFYPDLLAPLGIA